MGGLSLLVVAGVVLHAVALVATLHWHNGRQIDALLQSMALHEAVEIHDEGVHVHEAPLIAGAGLSEKYQAILDADCVVVGHSEKVSATRLDAKFCEMAHDGAGFSDVVPLASTSLRTIAVRASDPDGLPLVVILGVSHAEVLESTWDMVGIAVPAVLGVIALVLFAAWVVARRLTADVSHLSAACSGLLDVDFADEGLPERFQLAPHAAAECVTLGRTLARLVDRVGCAVRSQNRFIAEAAHELRTPLTALQGEVEIALRRERSAEDYREALTHIGADVARLSALSNQLLGAARARAERLPLQTIDLAQLLRDRVEGLKNVIDLPVTIVGEAQVEADADAAGRVIDNLLTNAAIHGQASRIHAVLDPGSAWVELLIEDDGVGIDPQVAPHLFGPFQKGCESGGGGLGLYIAQSLMSRQGGSIGWSGPGAEDRGARFILRFQPCRSGGMT